MTTGRPLVALGLRRPAHPARLMVGSLGAALALPLATRLVLVPMVEALISVRRDPSAFDAIRGSPGAFWPLLGYAWLSAAVGGADQ